MRMRARWAWLDDGPRENIVLEINANRIHGIKYGQVPCDIDLGDVCVLPRLVNAHCHLEFSDLQNPIAFPGTFPGWIENVVAHRRRAAAAVAELSGPSALLETRRGSYQLGLEASSRYGVGLVVDNITMPWRVDWLTSTSETSVWPLYELMGPTPSRQDEILRGAEAFESEARLSCPDSSIVSSVFHSSFGWCPHAPYTTPLSLLRLSVQKSCQSGCLVSMHLAESREELEWVSLRTGPFAAMLEKFSSPLGVSKLEPHSLVEYLHVLASAARALVVHGNYLDEACRQFLTSQNNLAVVYCPRTHAFFHHEPHPWKDLIKRGIPVFLGTDSLASNPDLSILEEARFLYANHSIEPRICLSMISEAPARFLGIEEHFGTLRVGSLSPMVSVACPTADSKKVAEFILYSSNPLLPIAHSVREPYRRGR